MAGRCKHTFRPGCEDLEGRKLLSFSGTYYVFNNYSDKVLDDTNASKSDGNHMQQFHLNGNTAQQWAFFQLRDGNYLIVNQRSGKALDVVDSSKDDRGLNRPDARGRGCSSQEWRLIRALRRQLRDPQREQAARPWIMGPIDERTRAVIDQWSYVGAPNQEWRLEQA